MNYDNLQNVTGLTLEPSDEPRSITHDHISQKAQQAGMELSPEHWGVIDFVLDVYDNCEECRSARKMMALMDTEFGDEGGKKYLYGLFPNGPVTQIHDLTGMKAMSSQQDLGFGTSF
ncbi:MAG: TusE/DsrC/DsvC family sulfur relay protein [Gammaproteobacteria bacterium]|nr:TusE/DsrC/DsvC family sulfur relay protein [Gammaproteobacteria bacterium]